MAKKILILTVVLSMAAQMVEADTPAGVLMVGVKAVEAGVDIEAVVGEEDWSFNPYWEAVREIITAGIERREVELPEDWNVAVPEAAVLAVLEEAGR